MCTVLTHDLTNLSLRCYGGAVFSCGDPQGFDLGPVTFGVFLHMKWKACININNWEYTSAWSHLKCFIIKTCEWFYFSLWITRDFLIATLKHLGFAKLCQHNLQHVQTMKQLQYQNYNCNYFKKLTNILYIIPKDPLLLKMLMEETWKNTWMWMDSDFYLFKQVLISLHLCWWWVPKESKTSASFVFPNPGIFTFKVRKVAIELNML